MICYCDECGNEHKYEIVYIKESVTVKDLTFTNEHEYCKCSVCGELYESVDDIDRNINSDYTIYRKKKNFLSPNEIIQIREKYGFNQKQFADLLGISHSFLSRIENGALQTDYQNEMFVLAKEASGFYELQTQKEKMKRKWGTEKNTLNRFLEFCCKIPNLKDIYVFESLSENNSIDCWFIFSEKDYEDQLECIEKIERYFCDTRIDDYEYLIIEKE